MSKVKMAKRNKNAGSERRQMEMKLVLSETCAVCKTPCERGLRYLDRMRRAGAAGKGVPCILTRKWV
ncbi:hypothetical protein IJ21_20130 [Paenibacillus sp. 32O-W]|jgi:hypothetical protein|uniref:Uncharacterized protein n=1 Tax=Paenibacillus cisolokensis TaxID=1658519 RepID=A0ABQ4MZT5_9BACL|nr:MULTISPECIES: hypothetical protein [Paenibacillus]ALS27410.1 hypothetical protein IJ21_20130 [Paenibacillus sp. 32O-W]GIQ61445.1 hypothetical protein PACILC2_00130 [Paenibacillus cisolokensis]